MTFEGVALLLGVILGSGGIVALVKARSDARNANKNTDFSELKETIDSLQNSYKNLQDRYHETILDYKSRCAELSERIQYLETEHIKQIDIQAESSKRIADLEIQLQKANVKIKFLEDELYKRDATIIRLEHENVKLKNRDGLRIGMETK